MSSGQLDLPGTLRCPSPQRQHIPPTLQRAAFRLDFPPSYVIVGVHRLCTDTTLRGPAWNKCKHGVVRGAVVGLVWAFLTFGIQKKFIEIFLVNSPRVTGLSKDSIFGYQVPFSLPTYAAVLTLGEQITLILQFFLSRNIRITRERVWEQTVLSRGKGAAFWGPYVEEWDNPPIVVSERGWDQWASSWVGRFIIKRVLLYPLSLYPFVGMLISAGLKALGTATYLHKPYFDAKKNDAVTKSYVRRGAQMGVSSFRICCRSFGRFAYHWIGFYRL